MIKHQTKRILASGMSLLALGSVAVADDTTSGYSGLETMDAPKIEQKFQINPAFTYFAPADVKDSSGDVSVMRYDIPVRYTITGQKGELALGGMYEYSSYDFSKASSDKCFNTLAFDAVWKAMINDKWGYFILGGIGASASSEADLDNGITGLGAGGARYVYSPTLNFGLGGGIATQIENDPTFLPVIIVNWQINEDWALRVLNGVTVSYDLTDGEKRIVLDGSLKYQKRQYRLQGDAAMVDKTFMGELGCTYRFSPAFALRGFAGLTFGRDLEVRANDDHVADNNLDTAPYFGVRGMFTF